ncbi:GGDEF domain-containing protein, partial [Bacillus sp. MHSD17]|nr:GGDEF domain-containing protein [Bacillus sp. MHSD17]
VRSNSLAHRTTWLRSDLTERVRMLEQYIGESKLLTRQEFERRQALLINAMNRRNETGVMIYFDFTSFSKYTKESVMDRVASLLVGTVRADFDLAAEYDTNTLVILLQNTNETGADIVMNRLKPKMEQWLAAEAIQDIKISREQIGNKGQTLL